MIYRIISDPFFIAGIAYERGGTVNSSLSQTVPIPFIMTAGCKAGENILK